MKNVDLILSKEQEAKKLQDQINTLNEKVANLNIALGAKTEVLKSKDDEIKRIQEKSKESDKVIIKETPTRSSNGRVYCPSCGNLTSTITNNCGYCGKSLVSTTYTNLSDVTSEIRKDIEKSTKKSISELENIQLDLEIKVEDLTKQLARKDKVANSNQEEWEEKTRKRYNKLVEAHRDEISELKEEIQKIKKDKTDEQIEAKRKEDLVTLKTTIELLTKKLEASEKVGLIQRILNKLFNIPAKKQAVKELEEARMAADKVKFFADQQEARLYNRPYSTSMTASLDSYMYYGTTNGSRGY
jgi:DNA repair exonuclease SbcCD ATPase subunit